MKLYHGTSRANAERIDQEGIVALELIPGVPTTGYVYMTMDQELARAFGEVVFEIESDALDQVKLDTYEEGIGLIHNYQGNIAPGLVKRL